MPLDRYQDYSAIVDPDLKWGANFVARSKLIASLGPERIASLLAAPPIELSSGERQALLQHQWATAKRAICFRTPHDNPHLWRNAVPPDRVPIILDFKMAKATAVGFELEASSAADYQHSMKYRYCGFSTAAQATSFLTTVTRQHKTNAADRTVGHELVFLRQDTLISLYLGNDGQSPDLPAAFREVRVMKSLNRAYEDVLGDIEQAQRKVDSTSERGQQLQHYGRNYLGYLAALDAG